MITSLGFAQQVLIEDFETNTNYTFAGFEGLGSATIATDPVVAGTRLNGLKLESVAGGNPWQGAEVILNDEKIKLKTDKTIKVDVYATKAFTMLCKVESGSGANSAASQSYTTPGVWQTLTFTMNQSLDNTAVANGDYGKIVFFPNWKSTNDGFNTPTVFTVQVDNITAESSAIVVVVDPVPPTAAPTPPVRPSGDVISLFSDAYANVARNFDAGWCGSASVKEILVDGNKTAAYQGNNCQGIVLDAGVDASSFTRLHFDVYIEAGTDLTSSVFNVKFVQQPGGAALEINLNVASSPALVAGSWLEVDIPVALTTFTGFKEFGITSNLNKKVWYDNLYAHKGTLSTEKFETLGVTMYPNPTSSKVTIEAKNSIERVSLHNVLGQEILVKTPKSQTTTLDISNLQAGVYVVKTTINGKVASSRVVKK